MILNGATSGLSPTGTFTLTSDFLLAAGVTKIVIPKGMTMRAFARQLSSLATLFINWQFANDGVTFRTLFTDQLPASGPTEFDEEVAHRPRMFRSSAGTEAVQITYTGAAVGNTIGSVAFNVEFTQDDNALDHDY